MKYAVRSNKNQNKAILGTRLKTGISTHIIYALWIIFVVKYKLKKNILQPLKTIIYD